MSAQRIANPYDLAFGLRGIAAEQMLKRLTCIHMALRDGIKKKAAKRQYAFSKHAADQATTRGISVTQRVMQ